MGRGPSGGRTLHRQWLMLRCVPRAPARISVRELARRLDADGFEVSDRTIQRDLHELSTWLPLVADERGKPFGWSFASDSMTLALPALSNHEALAFVTLDRLGSNYLPSTVLTGLAGHFRFARQQLAESMTGRWLDKIRVIDPTMRLRLPRVVPGVYRVLTDALLADRRVWIRYRSRGARAASDYLLSPLALVHRGPVAYVIGTLFDYKDPRLFAMHRIERAEPDEGKVRRPPQFDLGAFLVAGRMDFGEGKPITFAAVFDDTVAEHLLETPLSTDQRTSVAADGRIRVSATVADTPQLRWWLLGFGANVEVLSPAELRAEIEAEARAMVLHYRKGR